MVSGNFCPHGIRTVMENGAPFPCSECQKIAREAVDGDSA